MPTLAIHNDAVDDLQSIKARGDYTDYGVILAFLQQAKSDPSLLQTLAEDWFGVDDSANYSVQRVVALHRRGKRIWRVKVLTVKGLAARDHTHPRIQRLIAVYDRLDLS